MMKSPLLIVLLAVSFCVCPSSASVFLPHEMSSRSVGTSSRRMSFRKATTTRGRRNNLLSTASSSNVAAMAIPGYGIAEQVFVGGFGNFLSIFNLVLTARILLSWVPQAQSVGALQPLYQITDPYLNLFRGIIPSIGGLDLSPLAAFFLLNVLTNATAAVGCELTPEMQKKFNEKKAGSKFGVVGKGQLYVV